jgi:Zn-dependent protease with chaperone function
MWKKFIIIFSIILLLFVALSSLAQENERDAALEQSIYDSITAVNPDAVSLFIAGTEAMDSGNNQLAEDKYLQVLELVPTSYDTMRRLSYVESELGKHEEAISYAQHAYEYDDSAINQAAYAVSLLGPENPDYYAQALDLAKTAAAAEPEDPWVQSILLSAGLYNEDAGIVRQTSAFFVKEYPSEGVYHYYLGVAAAEQNDWILAEDELLQAKALGFDADEVDRVLNLGVSREAGTARLIRNGFSLFGGWALGLVILFGLGLILSRLTIMSSNRVIRTGTFNISPIERAIRAFYRLVILIASIYFYISLPIVGFLVLALIGGIFYLFILIGRIPAQLVVILFIAGLVTIGAVFRGIYAIFRRVPWQEPGEHLNPDDAPEMWQLVKDVAVKVGTRPVDMIYIAPGASIAVIERGNFLVKIFNRGQRYLLLGLGALQGMTAPQLQAILAHEYGHFTNRDTAGGGLALQVRSSIIDIAQHLAVNRQAHRLSPMWLFLNLFNRIFLQITLGASRLQEVLADRFAVVAYGSENFIAGLSHVIRQTIKLDLQFNAEYRSVISRNAAAANLYELPDLEVGDSQQFDKTFAEITNRATNKYDSHPAYRDRIALAERIHSDVTDTAEARLATDLLPNLADLQNKMTLLIHRVMLQSQQQMRQVQQRRA